jgi:hypothetical protein
MAFEKPEVGVHVQLGFDFALVLASAMLGNPGDAVEHQHGRQGKAGPSGEKLAARAGEQALHVEARFTSLHVFYPCAALDRMGLLAISCGLEMF